MNVVDSNRADNPETSNIQSARSLQIAEALCCQLDQMAGELKRVVSNAAASGDSFDSVERNIHQSVLAMGRLFLDLFVTLQGQGDLGEQIASDDGVVLRRSKQTGLSTIRSIFGTHQFHQYTYAPGLKKAISLRPVSARMSLPDCRWSYLLQQWSQMLSVDSAYQQAMNNLQVILGGSARLSVDTAERINGQMGQ